MKGWIISLLTGPIASRVAGVLAAGVTDFLINNAHLAVDPKFQGSLETVLVMLAYAFTHKTVSKAGEKSS